MLPTRGSVPKVIRSVLYRDSGPSLQVTRSQQLEHRAYLVLLAAKAGVLVSDVVIAGIAGAHEDARARAARPARHAVVRRRARARHRCRARRRVGEHRTVARGPVDPRTARSDQCVVVRRRHDRDRRLRARFGGRAPRTGGARFRRVPRTQRVARRRRAGACGRQSLVRGRQLRELLPLLEPAALSPEGRHGLTDRKKLFADLREGGAVLVHEEVPKLTELRRVSFGQLVMAAATVLGFYLIINQFAGVDLWSTLQNAEVRWVVVAAALSPLPQFTGSIAVQGAVAVPLPFGHWSPSSSPTTSPGSSAGPSRTPRSSSASSRSRARRSRSRPAPAC